MKQIIEKLKSVKSQLSEDTSAKTVSQLYDEACKISRMHHKIKAVSENHTQLIERQVSEADTISENHTEDAVKEMLDLREKAKVVYLSIVNESPIECDEELSEDNIDQEDTDISQESEDEILEEMSESLNASIETMTYIREAFSSYHPDTQVELKQVLESISGLSESFNTEILKDSYIKHDNVVEQLSNITEQVVDVVNYIAPMVSITKQYDSILNKEVNINESDEDSVSRIAETYTKLRGLSEASAEMLNHVTTKINDTLDNIKTKSKEVEATMVKESIIGSPTYFAVYLEGAAIYGVGKTEDEAWNDAEEWADTDSEGWWKSSFNIKPCSEDLYNQVLQFGTPDTWGEVDGVLVTTDEENKMVA